MISPRFHDNSIGLWHYGGLLLIGLLYVGLGVWYSVTVPPFETPDEIHHYAYARHLALGNALPVQLELSPEDFGDDVVPNAYADKLWAHEGSQAPLYYFLLAQLISGIDHDDFDEMNAFNPRANIGNPLYAGNKNIMLYSAVSRPLRGTNLAVHIGRWFSLLLGLITLGLTYAIARMAMPNPEQRPLTLLVALILATIPQFTFISAAVSNDSLIICVSTIVVFWLARIVIQAGTRDIMPLEWLLLGTLLGLAALSKLQGLGLWLLAALTGAGIALIRRDSRVLLHAALPVAVPALAIAGWWYWRNFMLYGDWFGLTTLLAIEGLRTDASSIGALMNELRGMRYSFWGLFGWFNLLLPIWIYQLLDLLTVAGVIGLVIHLFRPLFRPAPQGENQSDLTDQSTLVQLLSLTWLLIISAILAYWLSRSIGSQGRLVFPVLSTLCIFLVIGLNALIDAIASLLGALFGRRARFVAWAILPLLLLGSSIYALTALIPNAYGAPASVVQVPSSATRVDATYGDFEFFQILAVDVPSERYEIGDEVPITIYMQTEQMLAQDYQLFIQFLNPQGREVANLTSHPGWGRNPTSLWQPGLIYADTYPVTVDGPIDAQSPLLARVYIGFVDPATEESGHFPVDVVDGSGAKIEPMLSTVALSAPSADDERFTASGPVFGDTIQLASSLFPAEVEQADRELQVQLVWAAMGELANEYIAYVHLLDGAGERVAGMDQPPATDRMPTSYWQLGDLVYAGFTLTLPQDLPAGEYALWTGLYEKESGGAVRLPITEPNGYRVEHSQIFLGSITK